MDGADDLEKELGIPPEATLIIPTPVKLLLAPSPGISSDFITFSAPSSCNANDEDLQGSLSAHVSSGSSMRGDVARIIIVGRQASAADIRIDHKSVSRRHTALYYTNQSETSSVLIVRDLGGKHGTHVDDSRLEKNGCVELPLRHNEKHIIKFGNAPLMCHVIIPDAKSDDGDQPQLQQLKLNQAEEELAPPARNDTQQQKSSSESAQCRPPVHEPEIKKENDDDAETDVPSTREIREKQIAAMVASFDSNPVYKKFVIEDGDNEEMKSLINEATNPKRNIINSNNNLHKNNRKSNKHNLPITNSITLAPGSSNFTSSDGTNTPIQASASVSTLCFEPSGARIVAGHRDGTLRFYDFHGMRTPSSSSSSSEIPSYPPFRIVDSDNDPLDNTGRHLITALDSCTGGQWLVGTTSAQPKVLDREGHTTLFYFIKGDTYVTNSSATKGHTAPVTGVGFHPLIKDVCWTCGLDGSIRQWDLRYVRVIGMHYCWRVTMDLKWQQRLCDLSLLTLKKSSLYFAYLHLTFFCFVTKWESKDRI